VRLSVGWLSGGWRDIPRVQRWLVAALAALLLLAQIDQPYPETAPLHHLPTLALILFLPGTLRRWPLSTAAVACILIFFALHTVAARWTYTDVPYDAWARALTGGTVSEAFGFSRNHFDRLVHLSYGLLAVLPAFEALRRHLGLSRRVSLYSAVESVLAVSALYEMFEWGLWPATSPRATTASRATRGTRRRTWRSPSSARWRRRGGSRGGRAARLHCANDSSLISF
jgi:putative membrane protein